MIKAFGSHEIKNKAEAIRRVWPALPKGKQEINVTEAAYYLFVFAATSTIREIHDKEVRSKLWSAAYSKNSKEGQLLVVFLGELIRHEGRYQGDLIEQVTVILPTGEVEVTLSSGAVLKFPDRRVERPSVIETTTIYPEFFAELGKLFSDSIFTQQRPLNEDDPEPSDD